MGSKWRKVKLALGLNLCVYVPTATLEDSPPPSDRFSDAALISFQSLSPANSSVGSPRPPSPGFRLSKSFSRSSKKTCTICLGTMKRGDGNAIFTAECSHSFHFNCIVSNVKHGNQICPVCRAKWKEIPLQSPSLDPPPPRRARISPLDWPQNNGLLPPVVRQMPTPPRPNTSREPKPIIFQASEPVIFNDDESLDHQFESANKSSSSSEKGAAAATNDDSRRTITIKNYPEVPAVPRLEAFDNFTVLIHLKAPVSVSGHNPIRNQAHLLSRVTQTLRTSVDLVTVLDISGSMAGTKLALLKRAMGFVIQNLGPNDRLAVIAFSSTARRLFPLRRMSETGRQQALQAVNSLVANGGTNIAEGLRKGAKVMEDRKEKNPVASIILLSDGQDTYTTVNGSSGSQQQPNYQLLLPLSIQGKDGLGFKVPVHTFGFGMDHDASSMHSISEISGGTFSFIETESVIQDAFAQCIGGLLSVVVKDLQVIIESVHPRIRLGSLKAGSYPNRVVSDGKTGYINAGDLYAEEGRGFLVSVDVPAEYSASKTPLLKVKCVYTDPLTKETVSLESEEVWINRPEIPGQEGAIVSIEVDRQRNRVKAAEAMAEARAAAEQGGLSLAVSILENCRRALSETVSAKSNDRLCIALDAELKEMQERMASRHVYKSSGRAYILSGLSSHSWQRATARGDSTDGSSLVQSYQTPSMVEMLSRSQATLLGSPSAQRLIQPLWAFASQPKPR